MTTSVAARTDDRDVGDAVLRAVLDVATLTEIVSGLAAAPDLWRSHVLHDTVERARVRLLSTPAYEVWLLGWTPGQSVGLHDHGAANGAFVVVDGELVESTAAASASGRPTGWRVRDRRLGVSGIGRIPAGAVHDVANRASRNATSIHAYSRPLTSMAFYAGDGSMVRVEEIDGPVPAVHRDALDPALGPLVRHLDLPTWPG